MDHFQQLRLLEAMLFAASAPVPVKTIVSRMPEGTDVKALLEELKGIYANRGVHLCRIGKGWGFRTAPDLAPHLRVENTVSRRMSRAAIETLAIIAYHQPITRAEIEEMRGVALSRGTLDLLLEASWIRPRGRRRTPGRPVTWGTSENFLDHFGLESVDALPGVDELKAAGLLDRKPGFGPLSEIREQPTNEESDEDAPEEEELSAEEAVDADFGDDPGPEEEADEISKSEEQAVESEEEDERPTAEVVELPQFARSRGAE